MNQIKIIVPANTPGIIADVTELMAARGINILAIDATDNHEHAVILLEAEPYDEALRALAAGGYDAASEDVIVIRLMDEPGALARVAAKFRERNININAMRIVRRDGGWASVILSTEDNDAATHLVEDCMA
jgi:hypothetical protein